MTQSGGRNRRGRLKRNNNKEKEDGKEKLERISGRERAGENLRNSSNATYFRC